MSPVTLQCRRIVLSDYKTTLGLIDHFWRRKAQVYVEAQANLGQQLPEEREGFKEKGHLCKAYNA